jgi:8-oxo-dGTP pyrophosphatase MutT (NUDIX family)
MKTRKEFSAGGIVFRYVKTKNENVKSDLKNDSKFLILNSKFRREWLVCKHSLNKTWGFPKGLIGDEQKYELAETAAVREVREEGGVVARIIPNVSATTKYFYMWDGVRVVKTVTYFLMEYVSGDPKDHDFEMSEAKFVPENEVFHLLNHEEDRKAFKKICEQMKSS